MVELMVCVSIVWNCVTSEKSLSVRDWNSDGGLWT